MTTELLEPETDQRLIKFRAHDAAIAQMRAEYTLLTVKDVNDSHGHAGRYIRDAY